MSNPRAVKYRRLALQNRIRKRFACSIGSQKRPSKASSSPPIGAGRRRYPRPGTTWRDTRFYETFTVLGRTY